MELNATKTKWKRIAKHGNAFFVGTTFYQGKKIHKNSQQTKYSARPLTDIWMDLHAQLATNVPNQPNGLIAQRFAEGKREGTTILNEGRFVTELLGRIMGWTCPNWVDGRRCVVDNDDDIVAAKQRATTQ